MTIAATERPILIPSSDPTPVEKAAVEGIVGDHDPETFLLITFHRPDGGARLWYAWTVGGQPLGDRIDQVALAQVLDGADWIHIAQRHAQHSIRGRIAVQAYPLRPVLADVEVPVRADSDLRRKWLTFRSDLRPDQMPAWSCWVGFGPRIVKESAR